MAICGFFAFALGYVAGLRFRVAVILPIEALLAAATATLASAGHIGVGTACMAFVVVSVAVQAGYGVALTCPLVFRRSAPRAVKA